MYSGKNQTVIDQVHDQETRILDLGCGTGNTAAGIKKKFPEAHITGVNSSELELKLAASHLDESIAADINHLDVQTFRQEFDLVICSHVLEHLVDPRALLQKLEKVLTANGRILVFVPNFGHWRARMMVLKGEFRYENSGLMDRTHLRFFTHSSLVRELVPETLQVTRRYQNGHLPMPFLRSRMGGRWAAKIDTFCIRHFPNLLCSEIGLELRSI